MKHVSYAELDLLSGGKPGLMIACMEDNMGLGRVVDIDGEKRLQAVLTHMEKQKTEHMSGRNIISTIHTPHVHLELKLS